MIVREAGGFYYLIRQSEHARQSGVIAAHLRPEFLGPFADHWSILEATAIHDLGWDVWDDDPVFESSGLPQNFEGGDKTEHAEIWRRTIFTALGSHGPVTAAYLARHASTLMSGHEGEPGADYQFGELLPCLGARAWPEAAEEERAFYTERGYGALLCGDVLSLIVCAGWRKPKAFFLLREDGEREEFSVWRDEEAEWTVRIDPWPFAVPALQSIHIDAVAIPAGEEKYAAEYLRTPRRRLVRRPIDYLPKAAP